MPNVKVKFTQYSVRANTEIGFLAEDESELTVTIHQIKLWASLVLFRWYRIKELQNKQTFYKSIPIKIEAFIDSNLVATFMQIRVTNDTIIKENDVAFPFTEKEYLLVPYKETRATKKEKRSKVSAENNFNAEKYFKTIEYWTEDFPKFGSPIIYTGWVH